MWMIDTVIGLGIALARVTLYLLSCIHILNKYSRGVIFRLGRVMPTAMPT
jgi:regulator of protease activity HflC (stomatin/prohibitin superfamily)